MGNRLTSFLFGKEERERKIGKAIGIDLGTTNTVFGIKRVHTEILKNAEQEELTPSCVTYRNKKYIVGRAALAWRKQDPENTIVSIKRIIGRSFTNEEVQKIIREHKVSYQIKPLSTGTEQSIAVVLNGREHTPEFISALILKKIKQDAEKTLGEKVTHAVITVPSYFDDKQKHATRAAAAQAGFKVQRLLPEPTAAAISFGVDQTRDKSINTILVYDFGGGTFDISVLTMVEGQFIEQAKGGDMWLGGNDIDNLLVEHVFGLIEKEYPGIKVKELIEKLPPEMKNRFLGEVREKVERAKIQLSEQETAYFDLLGMLKDEEGNILNIEVEITRREFEFLISPLVERSISLMDALLEGLHYTPQMIDKVLLVGGSSCIPLVQRKVAEKYGADKVMIHKKPMLSVAEGAAILSHRLSESYECPGCGREVNQSDKICNRCGFDLDKYLIETGVVDIVHSAAHDYYICLENNPRYLLVAKNTPLPVEKTEIFRLVDPDQKLVHLKFFNLVNDKEEPIGDLWLGIGEQPSQKQLAADEKNKEVKPEEIICNFRIDENNIIEVSARMKDRPEIQICRTLSRGKADEKLFLALEETIHKANADQHQFYAVYELIHRSVDIIQDINQIVDPETGEVREDRYQQARQKLDKAKKMLEHDESVRGVINYAKLMLNNYQPLIDPQGIEVLENTLQKLEKSDSEGSYEETISLVEELDAEIKKHQMVVMLIEMERAYNYYREHNSPKAERILTYRDNIVQSLERLDLSKLTSLLDEIMPEVVEVAEIERSQKLTVEKGITK
ncbi:MAG: Hsp70 family protein [bacterium]|nr:Hsp70 family protein [bacterium]